MRYASVCDGISAVSVAWTPLGWECSWCSEIDPFANAVLAHRWPSHANVGDMLKIDERIRARGPIDVLVGGTPCQSFSVAGLRGGLDDPRGNLALRFCQLAGVLRPRWIVWENVPGVLSSGGGRDFGAIVGALVQLGYGLSWRVLDAQFFGVPQRRRRVFVVGCLGNWRRAAALLFDTASLRGNSATSRQAKQDVAGTLAPGAHPGGFNGRDAESGLLVAYKCQGTNVGPMGTLRAGNGNETGGVPFIPLSLSGRARGDDGRGYGRPEQIDEGIVGTLDTVKPHRVLSGPLQRVRRLTPRECERLQGFPDDYTLVPYRGKPAKDGPRYKAIGNSMAVPVMRWIGMRIEFVDKLGARA